MARHNWDSIIENLKNHPGEWILVAELSHGWGAGEAKLQAAGMELRREPVTSKLYNVFARCPEPEKDTSCLERDS